MMEMERHENGKKLKGYRDKKKEQDITRISVFCGFMHDVLIIKSLKIFKNFFLMSVAPKLLYLHNSLQLSIYHHKKTKTNTLLKFSVHRS